LENASFSYLTTQDSAPPQYHCINLIFTQNRPKLKEIWLPKVWTPKSHMESHAPTFLQTAIITFITNSHPKWHVRNVRNVVSGVTMDDYLGRLQACLDLTSLPRFMYAGCFTPTGRNEVNNKPTKDDWGLLTKHHCTFRAAFIIASMLTGRVAYTRTKRAGSKLIKSGTDAREARKQNLGHRHFSHFSHVRNTSQSDQNISLVINVSNIAGSISNPGLI
jgi:hypothetical protein